MKLHCYDVTLNPTNYELSDSVAATEGVFLYSGFQTTIHWPNTDFENFRTKQHSKRSRSKINFLKTALYTYNSSLHINTNSHLKYSIRIKPCMFGNPS